MTPRRLVAAARQLGLAALLLAAATAYGAQPPEWAVHAPSDWLVVVEARDIPTVRRTVQSLTEPWGREAPDPLALAERTLGDDVLGDAPWVLAVAETADGRVGPLLLAPVDDFERLCERLDADRAGDLAIARLGGYELALAPRGRWTRVTLVDDADRFATGETDLAPAPDGDVVVRVSQRGRRFVAEQLTGRGPRRPSPWQWADGLQGALERLRAYRPVAEVLANTPGQFAIALRSEPGDAEAGEQLIAAVRMPLGEPLPKLESVAPPRLAGDEPILYAASNGPLPRPLIDLAIAAMQSQPSTIGAVEYPQPYWDDFADAYRQVLEGYGSLRAVLSSPSEEGPVAANQSVAFRWTRDHEALENALHLCVVRWNLLNEAAKAKTPHRVAIATSEQGGWRLSVDLVKAFGLQPTPDIKALLNRYYGEGGELAMHVTPAGDSSYAVTMTDPADIPSVDRVGDAVASPDKSDRPLIEGALWPDRWIAWSRQVALVDADTAGPDREPMTHSPPARVTVAPSEDGQSLDAVFSLPMKTYRAAAAWRRPD